MGVFECKFCLRVMKSERGLGLHQSQNKCCVAIQKSLKTGCILECDSEAESTGEVESGHQHQSSAKRTVTGAVTLQVADSLQKRFKPKVATLV